MIERVKAILDRHGVQYAVIGAMAMTARGYARFTLDFDFLTTDKLVLREELWEEFLRDGIDVAVRKGACDDPLGGVVRIGGGNGVDVVFGKWKWEQRAIERAEPLEVAGLIMPVAAASDLILMKLNAGSYLMKLNAGGYRHRLDVRALLEVGPREQLIAEVEEKLGDFPSTAEKEARALWKAILAEP